MSSNNLHKALCTIITVITDLPIHHSAVICVSNERVAIKVDCSCDVLCQITSLELQN